MLLGKHHIVKNKKTQQKLVKWETNSQGFTILEILIVLVITGILASMAYPSYQDYLTRARRSEGQSALLNLANRMEQYYSENNTYQTNMICTKDPTTNVLTMTNTSSNKWYTLAVVSSTASTYSLIATPTGIQGAKDTKCQTLTLNSQGSKGITAGPVGTPTSLAEACW